MSACREIISWLHFTLEIHFSLLRQRNQYDRRWRAACVCISVFVHNPQRILEEPPQGWSRCLRDTSIRVELGRKCTRRYVTGGSNVVTPRISPRFVAALIHSERVTWGAAPS